MEIDWPVPDADFNKIVNGEIVVIEMKADIKEGLYDYAVSFKEAAHILTEYLINEPRIDRLDFYFFSVAYFYRHSVELILKAIAFNYILELDKRKTFLKDTFHSLGKIFETITPYIQELIEMEAYDWITKYFIDINTIDKESDSFRYPFRICTEKKNICFNEEKIFSIKPIFEKQTHIDLVAFANKLEIVFDLLDSVYKNKVISDKFYKQYNPVFIEQGGNYYGQSVVGYGYNKEKFYPFVRAYNESAEYLYKRICKDSNLKDILFIPMCYMYRNAVEISIKEILFEECNFTFQKAVEYMSRKKHSILGLWNIIKGPVTHHADAPKGDVTIENVERYITQLHNIDSSSDKFRYPTNKNLDYHFRGKQKFDIDNVNKFFSELLSFLSGVNGLMAQYNEWQAEMMYNYNSSDYYNEY